MKGSKMAKQRKSGDLLGVRMNKGATIQMNDGWRGKVEQDCGSFVVCLRDGALPDVHWSGSGYRLVGRRSMTISADKAAVSWKSTATVSRPPAADREERRRDVVVYLERARLERSWSSVTGGH